MRIGVLRAFSDNFSLLVNYTDKSCFHRYISWVAPNFLLFMSRLCIGEFILLRLRSNPLLTRNYGISIKSQIPYANSSA
jgi:hypothetical protein